MQIENDIYMIILLFFTGLDMLSYRCQEDKPRTSS